MQRREGKRAGKNSFLNASSVIFDYYLISRGVKEEKAGNS